MWTTKSFEMINQLNIVVSDAVVVRCILQIIIYTAIILITGDRFLPEDNRKKVYTLIQGTKLLLST